MSDYSELFDKDFREGREDAVLTNKATQRYSVAFGLVANLKFEKALDVGCANGRFAGYLAYRNEFWGIDISETAIGQAKEYWKHMPNRFHFTVGNLTSIPFPDSMFDLISCLDVIYYLDNPSRRKAADELARVLKPNGYLLISTSWPWRTKTRTGTSYMKEWEVEILLAKNFTLLRDAKTSGRLGFWTGAAMLFRYESQ